MVCMLRIYKKGTVSDVRVFTALLNVQAYYAVVYFNKLP